MAAMIAAGTPVVLFTSSARSPECRVVKPIACTAAIKWDKAFNSTMSSTLVRTRDLTVFSSDPEMVIVSIMPCFDKPNPIILIIAFHYNAREVRLKQALDRL